MSKSSEEAGSAGEASTGPEANRFTDMFKKSVNRTLDAKKKDDKLIQTVEALKKAMLEVVAQVLQSQSDPMIVNKFMGDFWRAFEARVKQKELAEVKKQLKSKGIPDLRASMASIAHATVYDALVLPSLDGKKERPANAKFVGIFEGKFDKELDNILKKKEFKMYKEASAEVASRAIQKASELGDETAKKDKELAELKQPSPQGLTGKEQLMRNRISDLEEERDSLNSQVQDLQGQLSKTEVSGADTNALKMKNDQLSEDLNDSNNMIADLERERDKLQEDLKTERANSKKLNQGQGSAQGRAKALEDQVKEQSDNLIARQKQINDMEEQVKTLQKDYDEAKEARSAANEYCESVQIEFEEYKKNNKAQSSSGSNETKHLETIKNLQEQAAKDKKEIDDLKAAKATEKSKLEEDVSKAGKEADSAKTLLRNLHDELAAAKKDAAKEREEKSSLQEKHSQLETTHREVEQKAAHFEKQHEELAKKHDEVVKAQETGKAAVDQDAAKKLANLQKECDQLKGACKKFKEAEKSLSTITTEQSKQLKKLEADKAAAADVEKQLAAVQKERDTLQTQRDDFQAAGQKLNGMMAEQTKRIKKLEADKEAAAALGKQLEALQKKHKDLVASQDNVKAENKKLNETVKEQAGQLQNLAAAKAGGKVAEERIKNLERQIKDLEVTQDEVKDQKAKSDEQALSLDRQVKDLESNIRDLEATGKEREAALAQLTSTEGTQKTRIKELEDRNNELVESLKKQPKGNTGSGSGDGLETVTEEDEEDTAGMTAEQVAGYRKQIAEAQQALNNMTRQHNQVSRDLTRLQSRYNHTERRAEDSQATVDRMEEELAAARTAAATARAAENTAKEAEATARAATLAAEARAAEAATQLTAAQAAAEARATEAATQIAAARAAAEANAATATATTATESRGTGTDDINVETTETATETAGPIRTMGEVRLPERNMDPVAGILRNSNFTGAANLFNGGAGETVGTGGGGVPGTPATQTGEQDGNREFNIMMLTMAVMIILAFLAMGAEGHKASIWMAANHLTRAQYANEWYYLTVPLPQFSYMWDLFMACVK
ncbi:hypothetical protein PG993_004349 [Apiospora rasikravindrae]|uniref:Uncharacterized protein n=1 Tax=Apiospora rasikravindrae TaxID=990691 RepID=A0ABR1TCH3_9PEZI